MRSPHPKCGAIPASLHPDIVLNFSVSGQICGQTTLLRDYRKEECPKKSVFTRVFGLWKNEKTGTACMLPKQARYQLRYIPIIKFLVVFCKWSNLWSNRKLSHFCEEIECRKSQCFQRLSAVLLFTVSVVGVLLPNQARYQLRYIPKINSVIISNLYRLVKSNL